MDSDNYSEMVTSWKQDELLEEYDTPMKGKEKIAKEIGLPDGEWISVRWDAGSGEIDYSSTIDEAYTQLLSRNKEKENN